MDRKIITINFYYYLIIIIPITLFINKNTVHSIQIILSCDVRQIVITC